MDPATIALILQLAETALGEFAKVRADLSASDQATIDALVNSSGAALDAARAQLDADAA